jgi:hypothetical protein
VEELWNDMHYMINEFENTKGRKRGPKRGKINKSLLLLEDLEPNKNNVEEINKLRTSKNIVDDYKNYEKKHLIDVKFSNINPLTLKKKVSPVYSDKSWITNPMNTSSTNTNYINPLKNKNKGKKK